MPTSDDMGEESLRALELPAMLMDRCEPSLDDAGSAGFVSVEHLTNLGEAHADSLAGLQDAQPVEVVLGVLAVSRRRAIGDDDALGVPVPQHMHVHPDPSRGLADLHGVMIAG